MKKLNCPFCKIISENSERIILKGKTCFVVLSNPRLMPGHILVIPNRHIQKLRDLSKKEKEEIIETAIRLQEKILKNIASGCDLSQHYRPFVEQSRLKVDHLHIHLRPRKYKDNLYKKSQIHEVGLFKKLTRREHEKIYKLLFQ